ncbi:MAG TPA: hypothetical protein VGQ99_05720 [Tepidisphaeraceae bacterium]|nr:hypothetical protein [Tepidisphaeraceae bacterium]
MRIGVAILLMVAAGGCMGKRPGNLAATQPATTVDPQLAEKEYWLARPASVQVRGGFEPLWEASEEAAHEFLFKIDRRDQRSGLLTTAPMISKQWWEIWRKDAGTLKDVQEATLANIRRTIYFQFRREGDGVYSVTPKVVVEKESKVDPKYKTDIEGPSSYWYALRRDEVVEKKVGEAIRRRLSH